MRIIELCMAALGLGFGFSQQKAKTSSGTPSTAGQPIGLLLALTKAS